MEPSSKEPNLLPEVPSVCPQTPSTAPGLPPPGARTSITSSHSSTGKSAAKSGPAGENAANERKALICDVCSNESSGRHYGAFTCDGCKAFFKRHLQGKLVFSCAAENRCRVTYTLRKNCAACRLAKCHSVGMTGQTNRRVKVLASASSNASPTPRKQTRKRNDSLRNLSDAASSSGTNSQDAVEEEETNQHGRASQGGRLTERPNVSQSSVVSTTTAVSTAIAKPTAGYTRPFSPIQAPITGIGSYDFSTTQVKFSTTPARYSTGDSTAMDRTYVAYTANDEAAALPIPPLQQVSFRPYPVNPTRNLSVDSSWQIALGPSVPQRSVSYDESQYRFAVPLPPVVCLPASSGGSCVPSSAPNEASRGTFIPLARSLSAGVAEGSQLGIRPSKVQNRCDNGSPTAQASHLRPDHAYPNVSNVNPILKNIAPKLCPVNPSTGFTPTIPCYTNPGPDYNLVQVGPTLNPVILNLDPVYPNLTPVNLCLTAVNPDLNAIEPCLTAVNPVLNPVILNLDPVNRTLTPVIPCLTAVNPDLNAVEPCLTAVNPVLNPVNLNLDPVYPNLTPVNPCLTAVNPDLNAIEPCLTAVNTVLNPVILNLDPVNRNLTQVIPCLSAVDTTLVQVDPNLNAVDPKMIPINLSLKPVNPNLGQANPNLNPANDSLNSVNSCTVPINLSLIPADPNIGQANPNLNSVNPNLNPVNLNLNPANLNLSPVNLNLNSVHPNLNPVNLNLNSVNPNLNHVTTNLNSVHTDHLPEIGSDQLSRASSSPPSIWAPGGDYERAIQGSLAGLIHNNVLRPPPSPMAASSEQTVSDQNLLGTHGGAESDATLSPDGAESDPTLYHECSSIMEAQPGKVSFPPPAAVPTTMGPAADTRNSKSAYSKQIEILKRFVNSPDEFDSSFKQSFPLASDMDPTVSKQASAAALDDEQDSNENTRLKSMVDGPVETNVRPHTANTGTAGAAMLPHVETAMRTTPTIPTPTPTIPTPTHVQPSLGAVPLACPTSTEAVSVPFSKEHEDLLTWLHEIEVAPSKAGGEMPKKMCPAMYAFMAACMQKDMANMTRWAKRVPGFEDISAADQLHLVQTKCLELASFIKIMFSVHFERGEKMFYCDELRLDKSQAKVIVSSVGGDATPRQKIIVTYFGCAQMFAKANVSRVEFILLRCIMLFSPDVCCFSRLCDIAKLKAIRNRYLSALKYVCTRDYGKVPGPGTDRERVGSLLLLLPTLRELSQKFYSCMNSDSVFTTNFEILNSILNTTYKVYGC